MCSIFTSFTKLHFLKVLRKRQNIFYSVHVNAFNFFITIWFIIFINYSGAEDKHGYLWDRHYGNCLAKLPHADVVNSVAFNPRDPEMLVTASDDFTLKVWRSKNRIQELNKPSDESDMEWDFINDLSARN